MSKIALQPKQNLLKQLQNQEQPESPRNQTNPMPAAGGWVWDEKLEQGAGLALRTLQLAVA